MSTFDAEAFSGHCRHLTGLCPSIPFWSPGQVDYYERTTASSVEELERIRDTLLAVGAPSPPAGFQLRVPRSRPGVTGCDWRPCDSAQQWKVEFERAVSDCVDKHKALQSRTCALAQDREKAMREADRLTQGGQNGWLGFADFEADVNKEVARLREDALAAQERLDCFTFQVSEFGRAVTPAGPQPERGPSTSTIEELAGAPHVVSATGVTPAKIARSEAHSSLPQASANVFARLPRDRYRLIFGGKEETVPMLAGLRVAEYLLKQPGTAAHVLEIGRALSEGHPTAAPREDALARSGEQKGLDGFTADAFQRPDPCSDEDLEKAKEAVESLDEQAAAARARGEHDKADQMEQSVEAGREWIRQQETMASRKRRRQPDQDAEVEKVRVRLTNNFTNACDALRTKYGFRELAEHLETQIDRGAEWKYTPLPGVDWAFNLPPR
jgi:hypothetical protein